MKQREIVVEHKYVDGIYSHCFDNENYALLELERKVYLNENKELEDRIDKAIEYVNNHQPVFELSNIKQIQEWFEKEYYVELLKILKGSDKNE